MASTWVFAIRSGTRSGSSSRGRPPRARRPERQTNMENCERTDPRATGLYRRTLRPALMVRIAFGSIGRPIDSKRCSFRLGSFGASGRADPIAPPAIPRDPLHDVGRVPSGTDDQHRGERVEEWDTQEVEAGARVDHAAKLPRP